VAQGPEHGDLAAEGLLLFGRLFRVEEALQDSVGQQQA